MALESKPPVFYEEDGNEIIDSITYMMEHISIPRMDVNLADGKKAKVYWAGIVLRVDIEGLLLKLEVKNDQ